MLSEKIYQLRRKSGLSQEQLAEKIGVSRQAVSKWEGGQSVPDLDNLKALSECFRVTIDELTNDQTSNTAAGDAEQERNAASAESKIGIGLCIVGAVCLILFGAFMILRPSAVEQVNASSVITLNGTGILIILFVLLMMVGIVLTLKKK